MNRIPLKHGGFALVDDCDYEELSKFKWYSFEHRHTRYAARKAPNKNGKNATVLMHRDILKPPDGMQVDHRGGNGLDNRRANIRLATHAQNMRNQKKHRLTSSRFKGVMWDKARRKWRAKIGLTIGGCDVSIHLGMFSSEVEAAKAYDVSALSIFCDFANLNFG